MNTLQFEVLQLNQQINTLLMYRLVNGPSTEMNYTEQLINDLREQRDCLLEKLNAN